MVDLMSNVAQMERERAKTERDRNDKVLRLVMYGVDVLKVRVAAVGRKMALHALACCATPCLDGVLHVVVACCVCCTT